MPISPLGTGTHPLRVEEVLAAANIDPASDAGIFATCIECGLRQPLSDATLVAATDPGEITVYVCVNGCAELAGTGHPSPIPRPGGGYRVGNFVFGARAGSPAGLELAVPGA